MFYIKIQQKFAILHCYQCESEGVLLGNTGSKVWDRTRGCVNNTTFFLHKGEISRFNLTKLLLS